MRFNKFWFFYSRKKFILQGTACKNNLKIIYYHEYLTCALQYILINNHRLAKQIQDTFHTYLSQCIPYHRLRILDYSGTRNRRYSSRRCTERRDDTCSPRCKILDTSMCAIMIHCIASSNDSCSDSETKKFNGIAIL